MVMQLVVENRLNYVINILQVLLWRTERNSYMEKWFDSQPASQPTSLIRGVQWAFRNVHAFGTAYRVGSDIRAPVFDRFSPEEPPLVSRLIFKPLLSHANSSRLGCEQPSVLTFDEAQLLLDAQEVARHSLPAEVDLVLHEAPGFKDNAARTMLEDGERHRVGS